MDNTFGTFYAVGVGPGDASLLTLQAVKILEQCPVLAAPQTASGQMLALDIARGAVDLSKKEILPLRFTMSRDLAVREESYRAICAQLEGFLSRGQDVAMVNLGDVSIYATAYYIFDRLQKAGFPAKMVPGITSFSAVAAQLGWSLTEENAPLHIIPGSTDLQAALHLPGTKVLMENSSHFQINDYLKPGRHAHLVGIGGVSMRPLGLVLRSMGMQISGSDMNASVSTDELMAKGIAVSIGHRAENIEGADCVIRTAAANNDNPEIAAARAAGIPIFERAQAWGYIMKAYRHAICVSGTHGKTTTTSMLTQIFMEAGKDPTVMIGGSLPLLGAGHRVGQGDTIILESCEYCNSFLNFFPTTAVVLDIDADHLDFFKDLEDVKHSFRRFAELVPADGLIVANGDDKNTLDALDGLSLVRFGMAETNDVYGTNFSEDYRCFDVVCGGKPYCHLELGVIGRHNAMNALAACAVCWKFSIPAEAVQRALHEFHGAGRRLEFKGRYHGADVYDDYSHHPAELHALLSAVRLMGYRRVICAFQPHTYSRTKALFSDFVRELSAADLAVLTDIYAARESNTIFLMASAERSFICL